MKIEVIIPVVNYSMAIALLHNINENTRPPDRVIIIDNTQRTHFWDIFENFISEFYYTESKMVNESWELGRSKLIPDCDYVFFLNDDLVIGPWFFQRMIETFEHNEAFGIVCPNTVDRISKVKKGKVCIESHEDETVYRPHKRDCEGHAFAIRKEILDTIPPIPYDKITTFHGDNWIWDHTRKMGYTSGKDLGNTVYHYVGQSTLKLGFRGIKKEEHNKYVKLKHAIWG